MGEERLINTCLYSYDTLYGVTHMQGSHNVTERKITMRDIQKAVNEGRVSVKLYSVLS